MKFFLSDKQEKGIGGFIQTANGKLAVTGGEGITLLLSVSDES